MLRISEKAITAVKFLSAVILGILAIAVFINVVLRFGFKSGIVATEELSRILLIWLIFGSTIAVLHGRKHIKMTMVVEKFPLRVQFALAVLGTVLMTLCDILLLLGAHQQFIFGLTDYYPVSGLTVSVSYLPGIIAAGAFILINVSTLIQLVIGKLHPKNYFGDPDDLGVVKQEGQ